MQGDGAVCRIHRDLAGGEGEAVHLIALGIGTDGGRGLVCVQYSQRGWLPD